MPEKDIQPIINEIIRRVNETTRRLRALEERDLVIEARIDGMQNTMMRDSENFREKISKLDASIRSLDEKIAHLENSVLKLNKILEKTAKATELKELKNLINLLNPLKSEFVTKDELEKIFNEKIKEKKSF